MSARDPLLILYLTLQLLALVWIGFTLSSAPPSLAPSAAASSSNSDESHARLIGAIESLEQALRKRPAGSEMYRVKTQSNARSKDGSTAKLGPSPGTTTADQLTEVRRMLADLTEARLTTLKHQAPPDAYARGSQRGLLLRLKAAKELADKTSDDSAVTRISKELMFSGRAETIQKLGKPDEYNAGPYRVERWQYYIGEGQRLALQFNYGMLTKVYR